MKKSFIMGSALGAYIFTFIVASVKLDGQMAIASALFLFVALYSSKE